jgi:dihydroorotate dehydrogenase electron transfer subunit
MKVIQESVPILHHKKIGPNYFRMGLHCPELGRSAKPGQFVMVRLPNAVVPFLRRPFSVHRPVMKGQNVEGFEILYKVVGQGTQVMSEMKVGEVLDVVGPLGRGFSRPKGVKRVFLVAGGVGVASLYYLAHAFSAERSKEMTIFLGGCSAVDILCEKEFRAMGAHIRITTEDCSLGEIGLVTPVVEKVMAHDGKPDIIYACGPQPMLKAVGDIAAAHLVPCQLSLEASMACGFGVCLGCAVEKADGTGEYFHVCKEGPVFDSRDVLL